MAGIVSALTDDGTRQVDEGEYGEGDHRGERPRSSRLSDEHEQNAHRSTAKPVPTGEDGECRSEKIIEVVEELDQPFHAGYRVAGTRSEIYGGPGRAAVMAVTMVAREGEGTRRGRPKAG